MSGFLFYTPKPQYLDQNGRPMAGGTLGIYDYGTADLSNVFSDSGLTVQVTNPIPLNARGEPAVAFYLRTGAAYTAVLRNAAGAVEYTAGPVLWAGGGGGGGGGGEPIIVPPAEVDRIIAATIADPDLLGLFDPVNASVTSLSTTVTALNGRIVALDGGVSLLNGYVTDLQEQVDLLGAISGDPENIILLITNEQTARINGDNALAATIAKLGVASGDGVSFILNQSTVKISADETLGQRLTGIASQFSTQSASLTTEQTTRANADTALSNQLVKLGALNGGGTAFVINLDTAYVAPSESLGVRLGSISATFGTQNALIVAEQTTRANADSALSSSLAAVQSSVDGQVATIAAQTLSINGIQAKYTVKIDNNGNIAGFGLVSEPNNGAIVSTFNVLADNFKVFNGASAVAPFSVSGGVVRANNLVVGNAQIENLQVGKLVPGGDTGFAPKAWARFYGISGATAYFTRQYGFATVTRISQGKYQFTFTTPLPNRFYIVQITATQHNDVDSPLVCAPYDVQTTGFKVAMRNVFENYRDTMLGSLIVFGSNEVITDPPSGYDYADDPSPPLYGGLIP